MTTNARYRINVERISEGVQFLTRPEPSSGFGSAYAATCLFPRVDEKAKREISPYGRNDKVNDEILN